MTGKSIEERRRYVDEVRASFGTQQMQDQNIDFGEQEIEYGINTGIFKLKAFIAIVIFAAFVYCDQLNIDIYKYKTDIIVERIQDTIHFENIIQLIKTMI
ncbi:hypothetical protein LQZ18_13940 [Lachnospiraceae bacterium ZAX-1]